MKYIAIIVCKVLRIIGKLVHKGSSMPGQIALKIDSKILSKVKLPKYVIAVSGSNGKTSTVETINQVLTKAGYRVAYNKEGSNQIEGVTTLILSDCNLFGRCRSDVLLMESDERYARYTFKDLIPTHFVLTNLYRDQLTRNGNPEWIFNCLKDAIHPETKLILNGDDPLITMFSKGHEDNVFFGINEYTKGIIGVYDDGAYCPVCKHKMVYKYRHYGNVGNFTCTNCDFKHHDLDYKITEVNLKEGYLIIQDKLKISLALKSIYNAYNLLATYALCKELNIDDDLIAQSLNNYVLKNGRVVKLKHKNGEGILLISKHENSTSYNQTMAVIAQDERDVEVLILVDAISRKYFTSETSWLWDIDFNRLNSKNVKKIILCGRYAYDLALRFEYTDINQNLISIKPDIDEAFVELKNSTYPFYVVTCFSDEQKVFDHFKEEA